MATFEHPITASLMFALLLIFIVVIYGYYNDKRSKNIICVVLALISLLCIIMSKMRSGIVFAGIGILSVVNFKKITFFKICGIALLGILILSPLLFQERNILLSIFNKSAQEAIGGSDLAQRISQFKSVVNLVKLSPIGGLGEKFQQYLVNYDTVMAIGFESVWLEIPAKHGLVGTLANIYLMYYTVVKIPRKYKSKTAFFLGLALWVTYSMTILASFRMDIFYVIYFYFIQRDVGFGQDGKLSYSLPQNIKRMTITRIRENRML